MACMTHTCLKCGYETFDNESSPEKNCEKCGCNRFYSECDDKPDPEFDTCVDYDAY